MNKNATDNRLVYKITKGDEVHIGNNREILDILKIHPSSLSSASLSGLKTKGFTVEQIGVYKKIYDIYDGPELIFSGTIDEVLKHFYLSKARILKAVNRDSLILGKFYVRSNSSRILYFK